jgi:hypothetical protein
MAPPFLCQPKCVLNPDAHRSGMACSFRSMGPDGDRGTFPFTGGTIDKVVIDVTGDRYVDHEAQVRAWLLTD